jgi:hypothetical protein
LIKPIAMFLKMVRSSSDCHSCPLKCIGLVSNFWCLQITFRFIFTNLGLMINIILIRLCFIHPKLRYMLSIGIYQALYLLAIIFHLCTKHIWNNNFSSLKFVWIIKIKYRLLFFVFIYCLKRCNILIYCLNQLSISP